MSSVWLNGVLLVDICSDSEISLLLPFLLVLLSDRHGNVQRDSDSTGHGKWEMKSCTVCQALVISHHGVPVTEAEPEIPLAALIGQNLSFLSQNKPALDLLRKAILLST